MLSILWKFACSFSFHYYVAAANLPYRKCVQFSENF
nr:MAG TPA: Protein of unknown function (DUF1445) [Caudoviricetes sp.]